MYKVLIAEDDNAMRFIYSKMKSWNEHGFKISCMVENGKKVLDLIKSKTFDIIFTDIRMPIIDGLELLEELRNLNINTPVILASSYNEFEYACKGLRLGAMDFIVKPISERDLSEVLQRAKIYLGEIEDKNASDEIISLALKRCEVTSKDAFIQNVCDFLSERLNENITLNDMAYNFTMNKDYFSRQFKSKSGVNFSVFLHTVKMEYAKKLIYTSDMKNYEIAYTLGYSTPDYFTKLFKDCNGITPAQYRRQCKEDKNKQDEV